MRRAALLLYIVAPLLVLSGCQGGNLFSSHRDMERLRPVQTLGLDRAGDGVLLSVSTGIGPDDAPALVMSAAGENVEAAIDRIQDYSPEDELFYAHVRYILLGSDIPAGGVMPLLDWVERSPSMRMDTPLLLVKGSASDAVAGATGKGTDVTERLASLERIELARGITIFSLRQIATSLLERGCALCLAVESAPSAGIVVTEDLADTDAVLPAGFAVLTAEGLAAVLTDTETLGTELLTRGLSGVRVEAAGNVLEVISGRAEAAGVWDGENGALSGLEIRCELRAGVLERDAEGETDPDALRTALAGEAAAWLAAAVSRAQALELDYLGLEDALLRSAPPGRDGGRADGCALFPALPVTIHAEARIDRSYDLSE